MQQLEAWGNRLETTASKVIDGKYDGPNPALRAISDTMEWVGEQIEKVEEWIDNALTGTPKTPPAAAAAASAPSEARIEGADREPGAEAPGERGGPAAAREVAIGNTPEPPHPGPHPAQGASAEASRGRGQRPR